MAQLHNTNREKRHERHERNEKRHERHGPRTRAERQTARTARVADPSGTPNGTLGTGFGTKWHRRQWVGWSRSRKMPPGGCRIGGGAPYPAPRKRHPALPCRAGAILGGRCPPNPPAKGATGDSPPLHSRHSRLALTSVAEGDVRVARGGAGITHPGGSRIGGGRPLSTPAETAPGTAVSGGGNTWGTLSPKPPGKGGDRRFAPFALPSLAFSVTVGGRG